MAARVAAARPQARVEGFLVQATAARRGDAHELICGVVEGRQFGPVVLFGQGGTTVELVVDTALALPTINMALARELRARTRVDRLLGGWRARPPADRNAVVGVPVRLAQLAMDIGEIAEIEINPLLASPDGVLAVDACMPVAALAEGVGAADRLAILTYPRELEERVTIAGAGPHMLRAIRPEDARAYQELATHITPQAARRRLHSALSGLDDAHVARLTQIDYDRELALVLADPDRPAGEARLFAVARFASDPDGEVAEFAIIVRSYMEGRGLGRKLLGRLLDIARRRVIGTVWDSVLRENMRMIDMCGHFGFHAETHPDECEAVKMAMELGDGAKPPRDRPSPPPRADMEKEYSLRHLRHVERVAGRADGADQVGQFVNVHRLAQTADVDVDGTRLDIGVAAPDIVEQLLAAKDAAGMLHEEAQQAELGRAERDHCIAARHAAGG
ncbi:MAG: GNAT family N-acetyltransferase [Alphaproteobacteria bacterium]|nr:GNAT family N-acetyltransferase [Alphaproteobacteria bacterium]